MALIEDARIENGAPPLFHGPSRASLEAHAEAWAESPLHSDKTEET